MNKKILYGVWCLFAATGCAFGQDYTFRVLVNHGENQVKRESGELVDLKIGTELFELEEIISAKGGYIGLVHKTGKTTEVRGAGTRKVVDIVSSINLQKTSAVSRYAQFIAAKMGEGDGDAYKNRTNTVGAISRGIGDLAVLIPGTSTEAFSDEVSIVWLPKDSSVTDISYDVKVVDIFGEPVFDTKTTETSFNLNFGEVQNESGVYIFTVVQSDNPTIASEEFMIKKVSANEKPSVAQGLQSLKADLTDDDPVFNGLLLADFFEANGLLVDAVSQYKAILESTTETEDLEILFKAFLFGNGIVSPPEEETDE